MSRPIARGDPPARRAAASPSATPVRRARAAVLRRWRPRGRPRRRRPRQPWSPYRCPHDRRRPVEPRRGKGVDQPVRAHLGRPVDVDGERDRGGRCLEKGEVASRGHGGDGLAHRRHDRREHDAGDVGQPRPSRPSRPSSSSSTSSAVARAGVAACRERPARGRGEVPVGREGCGQRRVAGVDGEQHAPDDTRGRARAGAAGPPARHNACCSVFSGEEPHILR